MRQYVIRRNGYSVVLTQIGKRHRKLRDERWEVEVTNSKRRTWLRYHRSLLRALVYIWRL